MGYDDISPDLHGDYCRFLEGPGNRKQVTLPRSFVKTWIGSIAYPCWITLPRREEDEFPYPKAWEDKFYTLGPDLRSLIVSYIITNAEKMIGLIMKTYESNIAMQILFPEVIPHNFRKTKWNTKEARINRETEATEATFEAAGIGGGAVSRHYDLIIEDDLIYANKDDFSGQELQPSQDDIDKAIGWHKLNTSLLVPGRHTRIHNTGTRWAKYDLVNYIWTKEPSYQIFRRACVEIPDHVIGGNEPDETLNWKALTPTWPDCYDHSQLQGIREAQGEYMFATQYLLLPSSPEQSLFKESQLEFYQYPSDVPKTSRIFTTVDLAEWSEDPSHKQKCNCVILTCAWCDQNHLWLLHYDAGRYDPSQVLERMKTHWQTLKPERIGVESVYYQKALAHFAYRYMDEGKLPRMTIDQLTPENNRSKDLRIRALEPWATSRAIHCKTSHVQFIEEWKNYVPGSKLCYKDILDALAYQVQIARPGEPETAAPTRDNSSRELACKQVYKADDLLRHLWNRGKPTDRFGNPGVRPEFQEPIETTEETLLEGLFNPFTEHGESSW